MTAPTFADLSEFVITGVPQLRALLLTPFAKEERSVANLLFDVYLYQSLALPHSKIFAKMVSPYNRKYLRRSLINLDS